LYTTTDRGGGKRVETPHSKKASVPLLFWLPFYSPFSRLREKKITQIISSNKRENTEDK